MPFQVADLTSFQWPSTLTIPSVRFRLFVAADVTSIPDSVLKGFAHNALARGMVYFCAWGPDCSRLHDAADVVIVEDEIGKRMFVGPSQEDTIMTTWHDGESLGEAVDYFINLAHPTDGFEAGSNYWLALSVSNPEWAATIKQHLGEKLS